MNFKLKTTMAVLAAAACWSMSPMAIGQDAPKPMRGADVVASDLAPDVKAYKGGKPGGQQKIARTYQKQPPVIPHAVENFDEITLEENQCLSCHGQDVYKKKNAPKVGDSHFLNRDGQKLEDTSSLRHNCVQCHVPQVDAPPLVENTFKGDVPEAAPATSGKKDAKKKK